MNRAGKFLLLLLLAQLALVGRLYWLEPRAGDALEVHQLLKTDSYPVDEIRLQDGEGGTALLQRHGDRWVLPALGGLPANAPRVEQLLDTLTVGDPGWPVAHTVAARQRLQVARYLYRLKVTLSAQHHELGGVYLGTSPGYRKVHARRDGDDSIYSVKLNLFDLPAHDAAWVDPNLLQVRAPLRIVADGYSLDRQSGQWRLGSGGEPDARELQALLDALKTLRIDGAASAESATAAQREEAALILQIVGLGGESTLEFYKLGDDHFVHSSAYPRQLFRLSAYEFDRLAGIDSFLLSGAQ